jgi:transcriptional regulator with XRE-family HTH domain
MTIPDLATKAGVGQRTVADLEAGKRTIRPETIRCLAGALGVPPQDLLLMKSALAEAPRVAPAPTPPALPPSLDIPPPKVPARTRLDALADIVRARGLSSPPLVVGKTSLEVLDPVVLQNLFARHAAFDGSRYVVAGRVERQRALSVAEARALKTRVGVGARYRVIVEVLPGEHLDVTVHAVDAKLADALQAKIGSAVRVIVGVRVVGKNDARVVSLFASARKRAWALVAVRIV